MSNNKKLNSVEWQHIELSKFLDGKSEYADAHDILNKAEAMHKQEMMELFFGILLCVTGIIAIILMAI